MAKSTGPILAVGGITFVNNWIGNGQEPDFKVLLGTAVAAVMLDLLENANQQLAVGIAWIALVTSLLIPPAHGQSAVNNLLRMSGLGGPTKK